MQQLRDAYQLDILRDDGRTLHILVDKETAERELQDWIAQEHAWANAVAESEQEHRSGFGFSPSDEDRGPIFDPNEFYVRRIEGLTLEGRHPTTIAYRFQEVSGMQVVKVV